MAIEFTINAVNAKTLTSLVAMCIIVVAVAGGLPYLISKGTQLTMLKFSVVLALACAGLVFWHLATLRARVDDAGTLTVGGGLYRKTIALGQIERGAVRRWSAADAGFKPRWRTNGIAMPGLAMGWFTSKESSIFAAMTDWQHTVVVPTTDGYTILVSPDDPDRFVATLRSL